MKIGEPVKTLLTPGRKTSNPAYIPIWEKAASMPDDFSLPVTFDTVKEARRFAANAKSFLSHGLVRSLRGLTVYVRRATTAEKEKEEI